MIMTHSTNQRQSSGPARGGGRRRPMAAAKEFDERVVEINRVTRVVKVCKRAPCRALVVIGDRNGRVAYGLGKAADVTTAVSKAVTDAKKDVKSVFLKDGTLPYQITAEHKSARVLIKPAKSGTGLIAGGPVRVVLELAGVKDAVAKMLGSSNKISNIVATTYAISRVVAPGTLRERREGVAAKVRPATTTKEPTNE